MRESPIADRSISRYKECSNDHIVWECLLVDDCLRVEGEGERRSNYTVPDRAHYLLYMLLFFGTMEKSAPRVVSRNSLLVSLILGLSFRTGT